MTRIHVISDRNDGFLEVLAVGIRSFPWELWIFGLRLVIVLFGLVHDCPFFVFRSLSISAAQKLIAVVGFGSRGEPRGTISRCSPVPDSDCHFTHPICISTEECLPVLPCELPD